MNKIKLAGKLLKEVVIIGGVFTGTFVISAVLTNVAVSTIAEADKKIRTHKELKRIRKEMGVVDVKYYEVE
jgi:hypothetical protein